MVVAEGSAMENGFVAVTQLTHTGVDGGNTVRLNASMSRSMHLLRKFRIPADIKMIDVSLVEWPNQSTISEYEEL